MLFFAHCMVLLAEVIFSFVLYVLITEWSGRALYAAVFMGLAILSRILINRCRWPSNRLTACLPDLARPVVGLCFFAFAAYLGLLVRGPTRLVLYPASALAVIAGHSLYRIVFNSHLGRYFAAPLLGKKCRDVQLAASLAACIAPLFISLGDYFGDLNDLVAFCVLLYLSAGFLFVFSSGSLGLCLPDGQTRNQMQPAKNSGTSPFALLAFLVVGVNIALIPAHLILPLVKEGNPTLSVTGLSLLQFSFCTGTLLGAILVTHIPESWDRWSVMTLAFLVSSASMPLLLDFGHSYLTFTGLCTLGIATAIFNVAIMRIVMTSTPLDQQVSAFRFFENSIQTFKLIAIAANSALLHFFPSWTLFLAGSLVFAFLAIEAARTHLRWSNASAEGRGE